MQIENQEIEQWLEDNGITHCVVLKNGTIMAPNGIELCHNNLEAVKLTSLPFKFDKCFGDFHLAHNDLESLDNFPNTTTGNMCFNSNPRITSFKGLDNVIVGDTVYMSNTGITSFIGVGDAFKSIGNTIHCNFERITSGGLGLVCIDKLLRLANAPYDYKYSELPEPFKIIEKYLGTDNIIECQSELIEAGYEEFAVL